MNKLLKIASAVLLVSPLAHAQSWDWDNNADLKFWAPGMGDSFIHMTQIQGGGPGPQYVGNYWVYVIKGISGSLTLGNRNNSDQYWQPSQSWQQAWNGQSSWATFGFQINYAPFTNTSLYLAVSGTEAGASTGNVTNLLSSPIVIQSRGDWDTSITFVPHGNPYFLPQGSGISNKTPAGELVILADIYSKPPEPTGNLEVSPHAVFQGASAVVSFTYDQGEDALLEGSYSSGSGSPFGVSGGGQ